MTKQEQNVIRQQILARPLPAQVVIKMIATKISIDDATETDAQRAFWMYRALTRWDGIAWRLRAVGVTEAEAAEEIIRRFRLRPDSTWGRILRAGTN